jgi:hypothetical protein
MATTGNGGAGCNYPTATHTPKVYSTIGSIGGWVTGNAGYMTSYLSVQNEQEDPGTGDGTYTFAYEGQVVCSVFGIFYDISGTAVLPPLASCTCSNPTGPDTTGSCSYACGCGPKAGVVTYDDIQSYYSWYMAQQKSCSGMAPNSCPAVIAIYNITIGGVSASHFSKCVQIKPQ